VREALDPLHQTGSLSALSELAALAALVPVIRERLEVERADHEVWAEAEEQRDAYRVQSEAQASEALKWRKRAVAAEAGNTRLRGALREVATGSLHMPLVEGDGEDDVTVHAWAPGYSMGCKVCGAFDAALDAPPRTQETT
jgi:hypothetical protein